MDKNFANIWVQLKRLDVLMDKERADRIQHWKDNVDPIWANLKSKCLPVGNGK